VARDRKRAKQRRDRRTRESAPATPANVPVRADLPGALDHASGDADEFDAALVRGAGGVAQTPGSALEGEAEVDAEDQLETPPSPSGGGSDGGAGDGGIGHGGGGGGDGARPSGAPLRGGNRALAFLRASWAELQRVQWPDRRQVAQATAVVLGFVAIAGLYLGLADFVANEVIEAVGL